MKLAALKFLSYCSSKIVAQQRKLLGTRQTVILIYLSIAYAWHKEGRSYEIPKAICCHWIHLFTQRSGQDKAKAAQTRAELSSGEGWGSVGHRLSKAYAHSRGGRVSGGSWQALLLSIYQHKCLTNKPPRRTPGTLDGKRNSDRERERGSERV